MHLRKSYGIDSIRYKAVIIWNKLQNNIAFDLTEPRRMNKRNMNNRYGNHNSKIEQKLKQVGKGLLLLVSIMLLVVSPAAQLKILE